MAATAPSPADDLALLTAVARGEPSAVGRLLDEVAPAVYGFILARVGTRSGVADDVLQETLLEGLRSSHTYRGESALTTWLCTIARRRIARHWEGERRRELAASGLRSLPTGPDVADEDLVDRRHEVLSALDRLPVLHRQVLVLKYLEGLPVDEIAGSLAKTPVQVQSLLQRARDGLRRQLGPERG